MTHEFLKPDDRFTVDYLAMVEEFHKLFKHPVLKDPQIPVPVRSGLRTTLIQEELDELKAAIATGNLIEVADALCDLQYVLSGTILEFGLKDIFPLMFRDVHISNMSKACSTRAEAIESAAIYKEEGVDCTYELDQESGKLLLYRQDRKTLKSKFYKPVDLTPYF